MRLFYQSTCMGLIAVIAWFLTFQTTGWADGPGVPVTITQGAPIETLGPAGNVVGVTKATVGTKMTLVNADGTQLTLQDAQGTHYLISQSATDYTPPAATTPAIPQPANNVTQASPLITNAPAAATTSPSIPSPSPAAPAASSPIQTDGAGAPLTFDYEVPPRDNFSKAAFRYWSPPYSQPIRGVIVMVPGFNGDGRGMLTALPWQDLARKYHLAMVSCFLQGKDYHDAMKGTGDALLEALKNFAQQASHPEIAKAPLLLYGESAGGQFNYNFALWKPEQVMVFVVNKGGYYNQTEPDARARAVPGLFFLGQKDEDFRIKAITDIWTQGRREGALWALAPQPNSGHEFSKTAAVSRVFFEAVLKSRLPADSPTGEDAPPMNSMQDAPGWSGDLGTHEIHDASTDSEPNHSASWLPDESSAKAWKAFVSGQG